MPRRASDRPTGGGFPRVARNIQDGCYLQAGTGRRALEDALLGRRQSLRAFARGVVITESQRDLGQQQATGAAGNPLASSAGYASHRGRRYGAGRRGCGGPSGSPATGRGAGGRWIWKSSPRSCAVNGGRGRRSGPTTVICACSASTPRTRVISGPRLFATYPAQICFEWDTAVLNDEPGPSAARRASLNPG